MTVEIIAEVAQGYEGDPKLAVMLARGAVRAGADAVKYQLIYADEISTPDYQYYDLFRGLEMSIGSWRRVVEEVKVGGARFYLDIHGERSLKEAKELGADGVKIHTTDFFNTRLVRTALDVMPRVFISFGGISVEELEQFIDEHRIDSSSHVCFMYGFQAEPTPIESNNLLRIRALKERFPGLRFGFMDHTDGASSYALTLPVMAIPFGIDCIEKHVGLDRTLQLEDYVSALPPNEFSQFVQVVRGFESALGAEDMRLTAIDLEYRRKALKVVVANCPLRKGESISADALALRRVRDASPAGFHRIEDVVGRVLVSDVEFNQQMTGEMLL